MDEKTDCEETQIMTIETTIGDLIYAITEAVRDDVTEEEELTPLTHKILFDVLERYQS